MPVEPILVSISRWNVVPTFVRAALWILSKIITEGCLQSRLPKIYFYPVGLLRCSMVSLIQTNSTIGTQILRIHLHVNNAEVKMRVWTEILSALPLKRLRSRFIILCHDFKNTVKIPILNEFQFPFLKNLKNTLNHPTFFSSLIKKKPNSF